MRYLVGSGLTGRTFLPMPVFITLVLPRVLTCRGLVIRPGMTAFAGVSRISTRDTSGRGYSVGIFVSMTATKLGNSLLPRISTLNAGQGKNTLSLLGCLLDYFSLAEAMRLYAQTGIASVTARNPVLVLAVLRLSR